MGNDTAVPPQVHYHIRWLRSGELDWERHETCAQAKEAAKRLLQDNEGCEIEEFDDTCVQCRKLVVLSKSATPVEEEDDGKTSRV